MRSSWPVSVLAAALLLASAAPAAAVDLVPSSSPLPGSGFQAADGDQAPVLRLTDWATLQAAGSVTHSPDPNAEDSAFTRGSKVLEPGGWKLTTEADGVNPAKDNIRDAWSAVEHPGARTFAYFAYAREQQEGTTSVTFELNRDARLWDNDQDDQTPKIPCRRTGDVLLSFEPHGNLPATVVVERWLTTEADPGSSCATKGELTAAAGLTDGVNVQGAPNAVAIDNSLPGAYDATIPAGRFGEVGIDLAAVLADAFGDTCFAYTSIWMHSRSAISERSNMQDYLAPEPVGARTCAAEGTKFLDADADGVRDPGEPGLARFMIFADYDGDGERDALEPFTVTDENGHYVLDDIRPDGTYTLREQLLPPGDDRSWQCSVPGAIAPGPLGCGWGPISVAEEPFAHDRDFGNWYPAQPPPAPPTPPGTTPSGEPPAPPGPTPPAAGVAGTVALSPLRRCLRRGSVVRIRGERIASVRVFVGGRLVHGLRVRPLRHFVRIRLLRNFKPGRYRVTARIRFEHGAATPPVTLIRNVRVCARPPKFTG